MASQQEFPHVQTHTQSSLWHRITEPLRLESSQLPPSLCFLFMLDFCQERLCQAYQEELFSGSGLGEFGVTMLKSFLMSQKWIYS